MFEHSKTTCLNQLDLKNFIARQDIAIGLARMNGIVKSVSNGQIVGGKLVRCDIYGTKEGINSMFVMEFNVSPTPIALVLRTKRLVFPTPFHTFEGPCQDGFVTSNRHLRKCCVVSHFNGGGVS